MERIFYRVVCRLNLSQILKFHTNIIALVTRYIPRGAYSLKNLQLSHENFMNIFKNSPKPNLPIKNFITFHSDENFSKFTIFILKVSTKFSSRDPHPTVEKMPSTFTHQPRKISLKRKKVSVSYEVRRIKQKKSFLFNTYFNGKYSLTTAICLVLLVLLLLLELFSTFFQIDFTRYLKKI